jgi:caa(3)-type oxidase subunit IV
VTSDSHDDKWRRLEPAGVSREAGAPAHDQNPQAEACATTRVHHPNYVKVWAALVVLLIVSVLGSMSHVRYVLLFAAFGVAVIKAYLVAKNFMHVTVEKRFVPYLLVLCLLFVVILFAGVAPDVMKHSGLHWNKDSAKQAAQSSISAAPKHE